MFVHYRFSQSLFVNVVQVPSAGHQEKLQHLLYYCIFTLFTIGLFILQALLFNAIALSVHYAECVEKSVDKLSNHK